MTENRQNRKAVSALIDVQDGLDEIKANLLLIDIARQYLVNNPEKLEILICAYLDTEPIKRLTELIKIVEQTRENLCLLCSVWTLQNPFTMSLVRR